MGSCLAKIAPDDTLDAIEEPGPGMRYRLALLGYRACFSNPARSAGRCALNAGSPPPLRSAPEFPQE